MAKANTPETTAVIPVKPKKPQVKKAKDKLNILEIAQGKLVGSIKEKTVEFLFDGQIESVDVRIKQLPVGITDPLYNRFNKGENVFAEWAALALVNEEGETYLTKDQIANHFTQPLANALFNVIIGIDDIKLDSEGKSS